MKYLLTFLFSLALQTHAQTMGGIGAQLLVDTSGGYTMPRIMSLVPGTPADSFLKATDFIMSVNSVSCKDKNIQEVVTLIRGEVGTKVHIVVADTKEGKHPREYDLTRMTVQGVSNAPANNDPTAAFNDWAEKEVELLRTKGHNIIKTFNATPGNRFFNFVAEAKPYHIMVLTAEGHTAGVNFTVTARVFDNDNEAEATPISRQEGKSVGQLAISELSGDVTFKKPGVGVVNVKVDGDLSRCFGIYVIVYR